MLKRLFLGLSLYFMINSCDLKRGQVSDKTDKKSTILVEESNLPPKSATELVFVKVTGNKLGMLKLSTLYDVYHQKYIPKYKNLETFCNASITQKIILDSTILTRNGGLLFDMNHEALVELKEIGVDKFQDKYTQKHNNYINLKKKIYPLDKRYSILYFLYTYKKYKIEYDDYIGVFYLE